MLFVERSRDHCSIDTHRNSSALPKLRVQKRCSKRPGSKGRLCCATFALFDAYTCLCCRPQVTTTVAEVSQSRTRDAGMTSRCNGIVLQYGCCRGIVKSLACFRGRRHPPLLRRRLCHDPRSNILASPQAMTTHLDESFDSLTMETNRCREPCPAMDVAEAQPGCCWNKPQAN
ncbi:hypothetical protein K439DRAFT_141353 [Ramaria rubella]|nr:hypothetical protein K439DRAFT_141353 [Ramaria rubella]